MAMGYMGKDKYGRNVSVLYCDICAAEHYYPVLHETMYLAPDGRAFCEMHAILAGLRPSYPGFESAFLARDGKAKEDRQARVEAALGVSRAGESGVESGGIQPEGQ